MKKLVLIFALLFMVHTTMFAQNNYDGIEIMCGAGGGLDNTFWKFVGGNFTVPADDGFRWGGGIEYDQFIRFNVMGGDNAPYTGGGDSGPYTGFTFFGDLRWQVALGKASYFVGVMECGPYIGIGKRYQGRNMWGWNINPQAGFSFVLSQRIGLMLNTRLFYKNIGERNSNVFGLTLGLGF